MRRLALTISILAALAAVPGTAAAASIWTPVSSPTTQDITAVTYQSDTHAWLGTANGQIFSADGAGAFQLRGSFPGATIEKIAFDSTATFGFAVSLNGKVYHSINGGTTWSGPVALPAVQDGCIGTTSPVLVPALYSTAYVSSTTAYVVGGDTHNEPVVLKSVNANAAIPTFTDVNNGATDCLLGFDGQYVTDVQPVAGAPNSLDFIIDYFGGVFRTDDGFASPMARTGEMVNSYEHSPRLAIDPNNPNRIWAADHGTCGDLCFQYSTAGGAADTKMDIAGSPAGTTESLNGIGFAGGTLVAAGDSGEIYTSIDGTHAYLQRADGALATNRWLAVGVADGTHALIGGAGGTLIKSTTANVIPDTTAPAGTISGPDTITAGVAATYTAALSDNIGGSGVDNASLTWTVPGQPAKTGYPVSYTFATPGTFLISLTFKDLAGNTATITKPVTVTANGSAANAPQHTTSVNDSSGAKLTLGVPKACVPAGSTFKVTLSFKKIKKKGATFIKVFKTDFYIGTKIVKHDTKAPFSQRLTVQVGSKSGSKVTVRARAFMKVRHPRHGKFPTKSIRSSVTVC